MTFTYYTIAGRNAALFEGHVDNVKRFAGLDQVPDYEFLTIVFINPQIPATTTEKILDIAKQNGIRTVIYDEPNPNFLTNLYACWNLGYERAKPGYVVRGGCDQVFSKNSFVELAKIADEINAAENHIILQANTIENSVALKKIGAHSRHITADLGGSFERMNWVGFAVLVGELSKTGKKILNTQESLDTWGHPTAFNSSLGFIDRTDGCSWLMTRADWEKYGPLPPEEKGHTGDVVIHDRLQLTGYKNFIVRDWATYHFVRGDSMEIQK